MRVGLIVAIETEPIFAHYQNIEELHGPQGFRLYRVLRENKEIYILHTGMGEIAAAAGTQYLITCCKVELIVNFGVVGGLTPEMSVCKTCIVEKVVHYKYDCSEFMNFSVGQVDGHDSIYLKTTEQLYNKARELCPELMSVTCLSGDKFISTPEEKQYLHETFKGHICEMEAAGILLTCEINSVPCLLLKAVSDGLIGGADEFETELQRAAQSCLEITDSIIAAL